MEDKAGQRWHEPDSDTSCYLGQFWSTVRRVFQNKTQNVADGSSQTQYRTTGV